MSIITHCEANFPVIVNYAPTSPHYWRELVHDALHAQPGLERWHNYVNYIDAGPSLVIYDQIAGSKSWGLAFDFGSTTMSVFDWGEEEPAVFAGRTFYTPKSPSKFLKKAFDRFVAQVQQVDPAELRSHLAEVERGYKAAVKGKHSSSGKVPRRRKRAR